MIGSWIDPRTDEPYERLDRSIEVVETDNPVVHVLLDASGSVIRSWRERAPIGFL